MSGLADVQITQLLEGLPRPYSFDPREVVYHFGYGWVRPVQEDPFEVIEGNLTDWIEEIGERQNLSKLEDISSLIAEQIELLTKPDEDGDEE